MMSLKATRFGFGLGLAFYALSLGAEPPRHENNALKPSSEFINCAETVVSGYQNIFKLIQELSAFIESNKNGNWKILRNMVLHDLKQLNAPAFENEQHAVTKITHYKLRLGSNRTFDTKMSFAKSRWEITREEAERLCVTDVKVEYTIPGWSNQDADNKRKITGVLRLSTDLEAMSFEIKQTLQNHVFEKSPDQGHQRVHQKLSEILSIIDKLKTDTKRPHMNDLLSN